MNNAKVIPARLYFKRKTGALIEVLLLEPVLPGSYEKSFASTERCQVNLMRLMKTETIKLHYLT